MLSWIHFGDLHLSNANEQNHLDFLTLIEEANRYMASSVDFALLPGDNADDGEQDQYEAIQAAIKQCQFEVHAITGDHDIASGSLQSFRRYLSDRLFRSFSLGDCHFVLLNSVAGWRPPVFGLGREQMNWLREDLSQAAKNHQKIVLFMHAYPSEHESEAPQLRELLRSAGVLLVEMGHTHYNELANDGHTIYAATRSIGQVEEGPPGFSVTTLDGDVVSWKFKLIDEWPLVMITSPADTPLIINPESATQVVRGRIQVRARAWGNALRRLNVLLDGNLLGSMHKLDDCTWTAPLDSESIADGVHLLTVVAEDSESETATDAILISVSQNGTYAPPQRQPVDYENVIGAWPEHATLITATIPDVTKIPYFTSISTLAAQFKLTPSVAAAELGIGVGDLLRPTAVPIATASLASKKPTPLPAACPAPPLSLPTPYIPCVLTAADAAYVQFTVDAYNIIIWAESFAHNATVVDVHGLVDELASNGYNADGKHLTLGFLGGIASLDGIHPTNTGYAIIANRFIQVMNDSFGSKIPFADIDTIAAADPLVPPVTVPTPTPPKEN